jgi:hypothetical protein
MSRARSLAIAIAVLALSAGAVAAFTSPDGAGKPEGVPAGP